MPISARTAAPACVEVSEDAVLAANYLRHRVGDAYEMPFDRALQARVRGDARSRSRSATGVRMLDIAKRLIDYGFHPPTIYFPLTVEECMLVEPTETESVETLDAFADALIAIAREADSDPQTCCTTRRTTRPSGGSTRRPPPANPTCAGGR